MENWQLKYLGEQLLKLPTQKYQIALTVLFLYVPVFDGSRPYQQLVFQYSLHIENNDGPLDHREYLAEINGEDPSTS